jgi:arylesterase/paraoxonase
MRPAFKSALTVLAVACFLVVFFAARWALMAGLFTSVTPVSPGVCRSIALPAAPGDIQADSPRNLAFVSVADRRHPGAGDGIYVLKLDNPKAVPVRLAGTFPDFHPVGISLYRAPSGSEVLVAINRKAVGRPTIETFSVTYDGDVPKLTSQSSIAGGLLVDPAGIFAIGPDRFYLANAHAGANGIERFAEDYLLWAHAELLYFDGISLRIAIQRLAAPEGVFVTPDGAHLYVTAANEGRLIAFSREPFSGNLAEIGAISLPAWLDKIGMDGSGNLLVAGHPSLLRLRAFEADASKPSPSEIFRVHLDAKGVPQSYEPVYANDGSQIGAASMAAMVGKRLLIGSRLDNKILDCATQ